METLPANTIIEISLQPISKKMSFNFETLIFLKYCNQIKATVHNIYELKHYTLFKKKRKITP